jgi:hypothetical protein
MPTFSKKSAGYEKISIPVENIFPFPVKIMALTSGSSEAEEKARGS